MLEFDTEAPGGGVDAITVWENQKAVIYFTVYLRHAGTMPDVRSYSLSVWMRTADGGEAAYMETNVGIPHGERKCFAISLHTLLIQPHLWQGSLDPHLYQVEVLLKSGAKHGSAVPGRILSSVQLKYPVCSMRYRGGGDFLLNGRPYPLHAVRYLPGKDAVRVLEQELGALKQLGVNCLCPEYFPADPLFYELCLEEGLLLWKQEGEEALLPVFCASEETEECSDAVLLGADRKSRRDLFYYYQAIWSERRVLHICRFEEPVKPGNTVTVRVFSNQKKVALYVNGYLREFKESAPVFVFEDVELSGETPVLSARSEECFASYTPAVI